eukprot:gnl/MRDRNA2_/MRDRNA2_129282_c0_seq1.p1 gnl/MRDRNA2_/MRDRNA2_129282_c0~~gnl/MRDRNA2_/MRDRNA2_129282_c0_seq1.p1  ORF type:complete len:435 (-),score=46.19 gnl/MRDRNA2_/MRDRNA2_129282_c0_seq1:91-1251(-)
MVPGGRLGLIMCFSGAGLIAMWCYVLSSLIHVGPSGHTCDLQIDFKTQHHAPCVGVPTHLEPKRAALPYSGPSRNVTLEPLPLGIGIDQAQAFLKDIGASGEGDARKARYPCTIPRLDRQSLRYSDFMSDWMDKRPFILPNVSENGNSITPFDLRKLRSASRSGHRVVFDPEYGTLIQRRKKGYKRCEMSWSAFLSYWATKEEDFAPETIAHAFEKCGDFLTEQLGAHLNRAKRTVYGRLGPELGRLLEPYLREVPLFRWRPPPEPAKSWVSTIGARTPAHTDDTWQFLFQLWGHKFVLLSKAKELPYEMLERIAEYPGIPDPMVLDWLTDNDFEYCIMAPGDTLYMPPLFMHDVFTLSDSYSAVVRWESAFPRDGKEESGFIARH